VIRFLLRRALWFVATTWIVVTVAFFILRAAPGGPFSGERKLNPVVEANLRAQYHKVHGFYIEVTSSNLDRVPEDYRRRQTLKNASPPSPRPSARRSNS